MFYGNVGRYKDALPLMKEWIKRVKVVSPDDEELAKMETKLREHRTQGEIGCSFQNNLGSGSLLVKGRGV